MTLKQFLSDHILKPLVSMLLISVCLVFAIGFTPLAAQDTESPRALSPATPYEFVEQYAAASAAMSAERVASFYTSEVRSIPFTGASRMMSGNSQQREELAGLFTSLPERGITSLQLTDYAITQISEHFAFTRLRWELKTSDGDIANTINSTYVLRLEEAGWRVVTILEMGAPHGP